MDNIFNFIKDDIINRISDNSINVFLCGRNPKERTENIILRDKIYEKLSTNTKYNIIYPEWLFSSILKDKSNDLLTLEKWLAEDVDVIVIPLEGYGTFAELGSFASFEQLRKKIVVVNNYKYKTKKSFINIGPIRLINKNEKRNIIYYNDNNINEVGEFVFERLKLWRKRIGQDNVNNMFYIAKYLLFYISLHQPTSELEMQKF